MRSTDELYLVAEEHRIIVRRCNIPGNRKGFYIDATDLPRPHILLCPELKEGSIAHRAVFAHELGHHFTLVGDYSIVDRSEMSMALGRRWDARADKWAINFMVRTDKLKALWYSRYSVWEIAEKLLVPEEWVVTKLRWIGRFN